MSLHRLSAGAGYRYLTRDTACCDVARAAATPLTAYYTEAGYPPGRWTGAGLAGLAGGHGVPVGSPVTEAAMATVFGAGRDPVTGAPLGRAYPVFASLPDRIATAVAGLPADLSDTDRDVLTEQITAREQARRSPIAVAGFDLTFTVPKSASVLWALADPTVQAAAAAAHRAAVDDALTFLQDRALFTRVGAAGCAQVPTRGMIAAAFDHWDTRTGDPNLHTHVVIANKVQGRDGRWRSVDSRALHHATVAVSELYDDLLADHLAARLPVRWGWRPRGPRRTPAFELDGITDPLMAGFSTRSGDITARLTELTQAFHATHGRPPSRVETLRLRQHATRTTRPAKTLHPLPDLLHRWRDHAARLTGRPPAQLTAAALTDQPRRSPDTRLLRADRVPPGTVDRLAAHTLAQLAARRSSWTPWNVHTETARAARGLRMASTADRLTLHDQVAAAVLAASVALDPPEVLTVPEAYQHRDGTSVFTRPGERAFTDQTTLAAEQRLLDATTTGGAPTVPEITARRIATTAHTRGGRPVRLADDQATAVLTIATSGRQLDVLVGPAGTGKTTTLAALRAAWETTHGRGSVIGLAPSATAAHELAAALDIPCENTTKWLHETTGPAGTRRTDTLHQLDTDLTSATAHGHHAAARRIATSRGTLRQAQQQWTLRAGQLLIVDEASLAGTLDLDQLHAQTAVAGAKLLLVGDHHQLSSIDAGGAFGLLAEHGPATELHSLWRFTHRWEADATRRLRHGDPTVLDTYTAHDRIHAGTSEQMLEAAYTAWQTTNDNGHPGLLVAADTPTVDALNTRAHHDRITAGLVQPGGIALGPDAERGHAGVGDRVITRRNDGHLTVPGRGHVRNGALWTITGTGADGSLTVSPDDHSPGPAQGDGVTVTLPPRYVADHVDLGYATTAHRAQGLTDRHG